MSPQRIAGIVLLVLGVIVLMIGLNASDSVSDKLSETFTGSFTDRTNWYILGGIGMAVVGLVLSLVGMKTKGA